MEHLENIILGPRYAVRVGDLKSWHALQIQCGRCRRYGLVEADLLKQAFPEHIPLMDLEPKMRCMSCGNREGNHWTVVKLPRNW